MVSRIAVSVMPTAACVSKAVRAFLMLSATCRAATVQCWRSASPPPDDTRSSCLRFRLSAVRSVRQQKSKSRAPPPSPSPERHMYSQPWMRVPRKPSVNSADASCHSPTPARSALSFPGCRVVSRMSHKNCSEYPALRMSCVCGSAALAASMAATRSFEPDSWCSFPPSLSTRRYRSCARLTLETPAPSSGLSASRRLTSARHRRRLLRSVANSRMFCRVGCRCAPIMRCIRAELGVADAAGGGIGCCGIGGCGCGGGGGCGCGCCGGGGGADADAAGSVGRAGSRPIAAKMFCCRCAALVPPEADSCCWPWR